MEFAQAGVCSSIVSVSAGTESAEWYSPETLAARIAERGYNSTYESVKEEEARKN